MERIDKPYDGDEEGTEEEHDGLLFDNSKVMFVVVMIFKGLDEDGHDGCGEEHAEGVFEGEGEVFVSFVIVFLEMSEVV